MGTLVVEMDNHRWHMMGNMSFWIMLGHLLGQLGCGDSAPENLETWMRIRSRHRNFRALVYPGAWQGFWQKKTARLDFESFYSTTVAPPQAMMDSVARNYQMAESSRILAPAGRR